MKEEKCCEKCKTIILGCKYRFGCPCHQEFKIVPSPRIDWCGACQKEHGYECPKDHPKSESWDDIESGLREALLWPKDLDVLTLDGDSRSAMKRAVDYVNSLLSKQRQEMRERIEKLKEELGSKDEAEKRLMNLIGKNMNEENLLELAKDGSTISKHTTLNKVLALLNEKE